jgi:hypothetical protein
MSGITTQLRGLSTQESLRQVGGAELPPHFAISVVCGTETLYFGSVASETADLTSNLVKHSITA